MPFGELGELGLDLVLTVSAEVDGVPSSAVPELVEVDSDEPGGVDTGKTPCKKGLTKLFNCLKCYRHYA